MWVRVAVHMESRGGFVIFRFVSLRRLGRWGIRGYGILSGGYRPRNGWWGLGSGRRSVCFAIYNLRICGNFWVGKSARVCRFSRISGMCRYSALRMVFVRCLGY